jgi:hypothetical protein
MTASHTRIAAGLGLIGAPALTLISSIASPPLRSDEAAQIAQIAAHPARFYVYALLGLLGIMLFVPALVGLAQLAADRHPRLTGAGLTLSLGGTLVAIGDATTELLIWQTGAPGADRGQMAALLNRYDAAPGSSLPFTIGGLALIAGVIMLAVALLRARTVPAYAPVGLVLGMVSNIVAYGAASVVALVVSSVILLVALAPVGRRLLPAPAPAARPATGLH